jgi:hypothetical protein
VEALAEREIAHARHAVPVGDERGIRALRLANLVNDEESARVGA